MNRKIIEKGTVFGRLTITGNREVRNRRNSYYECICTCGSIKWIQRSNLKTGNTQSCGCFRLQQTRARARKHKSPPPVNEAIQHYKYGARKRGLAWLLTQEQAASILSSNCTYCGAKPSRVVYSKYGDSSVVSGIDRADNSKGYTVENCVSCCSICNNSKSDLSMEEWKKWLRQITNHQKLFCKFDP
jgi:hypothetical protein